MSPCFSWPFCRPNHRFDLNGLSNEILCEILLYLPFDQRVRIARVNRRFQGISEATIPQTKTFDLTAPSFLRITIESMVNLIELCAASMENLIIQSEFEEFAVLRERLQLLFRFTFPRLSTIIVKNEYGTASLFGVIQEILVNIPSVRSLKWEDDPSNIDDTQQIVGYESLERVDLRLDIFTSSAPHHFASFLNNCSNLKHLALRDCAVEYVATMNRMDSLQSLILDNIYPNSDPLIEKIPVSFPQLVNLEMRLSYRRGVESEAVGWLATMKNLRNIKIEYRRDFNDHCANADALQLIRCQSLQTAEFHGHDLNPATVLGFALYSSQLRKLTVRNIRGIDSTSAASAFILSLADFVQQNLTIVLEEGDSDIWQCPEVKSAFKEINRQPYGRISIEVANVNRRVRPKKSWWQKLICWILSAFRRSK